MIRRLVLVLKKNTQFQNLYKPNVFTQLHASSKFSTSPGSKDKFWHFFLLKCSNNILSINRWYVGGTTRKAI